MEKDEIHTQSCNKFPRVVGNGDVLKIGQNMGDYYPDDEDDGDALKRPNTGTGSIGVVGGGDGNRLRGWHHSSRIIRVSRASGGKDRHSKVWTSKGLRDRRVRLSVTTAIQFYDLQDRLGYDQPSKAVEWLITAAADAIAELPSLNSANFPDTPKQLSDEKRTSEGTEQGFDSAEVEVDAEGNIHQNHHLSLSKSASSTSETSKGSGLSLSPSEIRVNRVKARERARERAAKEKEKENESRITHHQNVSSIAQNSSFTELLTGGIGSVSNNTTSPTGSGSQNPGGEHNMFHNYFGNCLLEASSSRAHNFHLGNSNFSPLGENHPELQQHFSFVPDHLIPVAATSQPGGGNDYNLNFTISSSLAGFNRGTLQSNSPSILPHLQRFSPIDGPFFIGAVPSAAPAMENHHHHPQQFPAGFDGRLQLCYGDGSRHSDHKGKGKN